MLNIYVSRQLTTSVDSKMAKRQALDAPRKPMGAQSIFMAEEKPRVKQELIERTRKKIKSVDLDREMRKQWSNLGWKGQQKYFAMHAIEMGGYKRAQRTHTKRKDKHVWGIPVMCRPSKLARNPFQIYSKLEFYSILK